MQVLEFSNHKEITDLLKDNGLLAFPTETVYGLGISSISETNYYKLMDVKKRDQQKALPLMVSNMEMIEAICQIDERIHNILSENLPGPFTFILDLKDHIFPWLTSRSIAIRYSDDLKVQTMITNLGCPMWVSSANLSNAETGVEFEQVKDTFEGTIQGIVKGKCIEKIPTGIYDIRTENIVCLRKGKGVVKI